MAVPPRSRRALRELAEALAGRGANLTVRAPGGTLLRVGSRPDAARVHFRSAASLAPLARRDHLGLAEAYLAGAIVLEGDFLEILKITELIPPRRGLRTRLDRAGRALRLGWRAQTARHYDRPPEFFLPWFERWRSYSHGFYEAPDDAPERAQARKLQYALDALGLEPGMEVLDVGCGWGSFLEFAGLRGIRVRGLTISRVQHAFVERLIRERELPCRVELADFAHYRPPRRLDGVVFMGSLEHFPRYRRVARFLDAHLEPGGRFYADFCSRRGSPQVGAFLARHIWTGRAAYVKLPPLLSALRRRDLEVLEVADDTASYACTVRDWADALEQQQAQLAERFGGPDVRAFLLYLRASQYFLLRRHTQAHHLVGARTGAGAGRRPTSTPITAATHSSANASPTRP